MGRTRCAREMRRKLQSELALDDSSIENRSQERLKCRLTALVRETADEEYECDIYTGIWKRTNLRRVIQWYEQAMKRETV